MEQAKREKLKRMMEINDARAERAYRAKAVVDRRNDLRRQGIEEKMQEHEERFKKVENRKHRRQVEEAQKREEQLQEAEIRRDAALRKVEAKTEALGRKVEEKMTRCDKITADK